MAVILRDYGRESKNLYYTWQAFDHDVRKIIRLIEENQDLKERTLVFNGIYGIPRGGLIPAVCLSHRLNIPLLPYAHDGLTLVVDDIVDSGATIAPYYRKNFIVALFFNPKRSLLVTPNIWIHKKTDKWIIFPWEAEA